MSNIDPGAGQPARSNERLVASFEKNSRETVCATLATWRGQRIADLRVYVDGDDGGPIPTRKGIAVRVEQLPDLRRLVDELILAEQEVGRLAA
jgi:hypothetical protein